MTQNEFEKLYLGEFKCNGDWPEVEKSNGFSKIYTGQCPICQCQFYGYKHRENCYPCELNRK